MADTSRIWVGEFSDTERVVFDTRCQSDGVILWDVNSGQFDIHLRDSARERVHPIRDAAAKRTILERYGAYIRGLIEANHRAWSSGLNVRYTGVRISRRARKAGVHCYICKKELDGTADLECAGCGWGICECGACGCARGKKNSEERNFYSLSDYARHEAHRRWSALPPRMTDPEELCALVGCVPAKVASGFCGGCDSNFTDEWCLVDKGRFYYELHHLAQLPHHFKLLESELALLVAALERGEVRGTKVGSR